MSASLGSITDTVSSDLYASVGPGQQHKCDAVISREREGPYQVQWIGLKSFFSLLQ